MERHVLHGKLLSEGEGQVNGIVNLTDTQLTELQKLALSTPVTYLQTRELKQMFEADSIYELVRKAATEGYINASEYVDENDLEGIRLLSDAHWKTFMTATDPEGELEASDVAKRRGIKPTTLSSHLNLVKKATNIDRRRGMLLRVAYPEEIELMNEERVSPGKREESQRPSFYEIKTQITQDDISLLNDLALGLDVETIAQMQGRQLVDVNNQLYYHVHAFLGTRTNSGAIGLLLDNKILNGEELSAHFDTDLFESLTDKQKGIAFLLTDKQNRDREVNELGSYDGSGMTSAEISFEINTIYQQLEITSREELTVYMHKISKSTDYDIGEDVDSKEIIETPEPLTEEQIAILKLLAEGSIQKQISKKLKISKKTLTSRISADKKSIYQKLGVTSLHEAVHQGIVRGYVDIKDVSKNMEESRWNDLLEEQKEYVTAVTEPKNLAKPLLEIAEELSIPLNTLKNKLTVAYKTLGIHGRMQALVFRLKYESSKE